MSPYFPKNRSLIVFPIFFIFDRIWGASGCRHRRGLGAVAWPRSMKASFSRATKSWIFLGLESDPLPGGSTGGSTGGFFPGKNWGTLIGMGDFMGHVRDYMGLLGGFFELWEFHMGMKSRIWYLEFSETAVCPTFHGDFHGEHPHAMTGGNAKRAHCTVCSWTVGDYTTILYD